MPLFHVFDLVDNRRTGVPMAGVQVRAKFDDTDTIAPIYADQSGTAFSPPNYCVTDADGMYSFYIDSGEYTLEFLVGDVVLKTIPDFRPAEIGPSGPANSTYNTTAEIENADVSNVSAILAEVGKAGTFTTRDYVEFTAQVAADPGKINYIRSVSDPTKVWVRTSILSDAASQTGASSGLTVDAELAAKATLTGVARTATNLGTFTGSTIPDNQAIKGAIQALETAVENTTGNAATKVNATAVGVAATDSNMGTTPGSILSDNGTAKQWFQESEAAIEARPTSVALAASDGSALGFLQSGSGAVARTSRDKNRERVTIEDFGGVGDGVADDTAAINLFLAQVAAGRCGWITKKTFRFTAALNAVDVAGAVIRGEGGTLLYDGASTTATMMTFGNASTARRRLDIRGFRIHSNVVMTGGDCIKIMNMSGIDMDVVFGDEYGTWRIYNGAWFNACTDIRLHSSNFCALNIGFRWNGGAELHCMNAYVKGNIVGGFGTGTGIHCGGGVGGFYAENLTQLFNDIGMKIDRTIEATGNLQFFFGGTFDSNKTCALRVDDDTISAGKQLVLDGWFASTAAGYGINIVNWKGAVTVNGQIVANSGDGIYSSDQSFILTIGKSADIRANDGYAVNASGAWTINMDATPSDNVSGVLGPNVLNASYRYGSQKLNFDPAKEWAIDLTAGGTKTILAGENFALTTGSGLVLMTNPNTPDAALFLTYGGNVVKIAGGGTFVSGAPGDSQIGLQFTGGAYRVVNGYATTQVLYVGGIRSRDAN